MSVRKGETHLNCWGRLYLKYSHQYFEVFWRALAFHLKNWDNSIANISTVPQLQIRFNVY